MPKDVSVEYAHIYTNTQIGEEQKTSLNILNDLFRTTDGQKKENASLVVLVDDYSFPDPTFDYVSFGDWLSQAGYRPDLILRESQLIPVCDEVLKLVNENKLREEISDYIRAKKYPCSLFIAAWYLLRLGNVSSSF